MIQKSRIRKTRELFKSRDTFVAQLDKDIIALKARAKRLNMRPTARLNGTSDLPWESKAFGQLPQQHPGVTFYDYTKNLKRLLGRKRPKNYKLVFSRSENNDRACKRALAAGHAVVVVFDKVPVGKQFWSYPVRDGDVDDLRFLNRTPCIIGVKAKGEARKDKTGFVIRLNDQK